MSNKKFLGLRVEPQVYEIVNKMADEEKVDKTKAVKLLVLAGWKEIILEKALEKYRKGTISLDKAAEIAGLTINEMMQQAAANGIKSDETIEEFREGLKLLLNRK